MSPNYKEHIEQFWKEDLNESINPYATRFFFFLVKACQEYKGKQPFGHSDRYLADRLSIALGTVKKCKDLLMERGLITYYSPITKSKSLEGQTKYWLGTVSLDSTVNALTVPSGDTVQEKKKETTVSPHDTVKNKGNETVLPTTPPGDTVGEEKATTVLSDNTVDRLTVSPGDTNYVLLHNSSFKTNDGAVAPSFSRPPLMQPAKEKKTSSAAPKKITAYTQAIEIYDTWFKELTDGMPPKIDGAAGKAMKSILSHLKTMWRAKEKTASPENIEAYALKSWRFVLDNWHRLSNYKQGKTKITEINSDFQNIMNDIKKATDKNGKENQQNNGSPAAAKSGHGGGSIDDLESFKKRNRTDGDPEQPGLTHFEVVE